MTRVTRSLSRFTQKEIDFAFAHARRLLKAPGIILLSAPAQKSFGRILIIASRKVGKAVIRNKLKRQLKAIFYEQGLYNNRCDLVCILSKDSTTYSFESLRELIITHGTACAQL